MIDVNRVFEDKPSNWSHFILMEMIRHELWLIWWKWIVFSTTTTFIIVRFRFCSVGECDQYLQLIGHSSYEDSATIVSSFRVCCIIWCVESKHEEIQLDTWQHTHCVAQTILPSLWEWLHGEPAFSVCYLYQQTEVVCNVNRKWNDWQ